MTIALTSPVTGAAQTGLTSPTYTIVADTPPNNRGKQWAVTALGGTQTGVRTHSLSDPFTFTYLPPASIKPAVSGNANGVYPRPPVNTHTIIVRKGLNFAANQAPALSIFRGHWEVPAGADSYDSANLRAMSSMLQGAMTQLAAGLGDTVVTGVV